MDALKSVLKLFLSIPNINLILQIQPEPFAGTEEAGKLQGHVDTEPSLVVNEIEYGTRGHMQFLGKSVRGDIERIEKLLFENLSNRWGWYSIG